MILMRLENILSNLKDAQTAQRGYLLTDDTTFLSPYQGSYQRIMQNFEEIDSLSLGNTSQQLRLDTLKTLIDQNFVLVHNSIVTKKPNEEQNAQDFSLILEGQNSLDSIRALIRRMQEEEKHLLSIRSTEAIKASQITPLGLILFFCLALVLCVVSFLYTSKNLNSLRATGKKLKKSNKALQDTKQTLQGILNSAVSGIVVFKAMRNKKEEIINFEMVLANPAAAHLTGHDLENNLNKKMLDIFPESKSSKRFEQYVQVVKTGRPLSCEHFSPYYEKWFLFSVVKLEEDGIALTFSDISDQKRAEVQLKETRHFLEEITDATPDVIAVLKIKEGKVAYVSKEIFNATGYAVAEIYAMDAEDRERLIHPADRNKRREYFEGFLASQGNKVKETEYRIKDINGKWRTFCVKFKVFKRDEDLMPAELIGIAQDITDKKEKETAIDRKNEELLYAYDELKKVKEYLLKANQELEQRVKERTKTLSDKNHELLKIKESLDTVVYMAAHDLRSPVSSLNLLVSLFEKSQDNLKKENFMSAIKSSAKRLDQTIKGLVEVIDVQHMQSDVVKELEFSAVIAPILEENKEGLLHKKGKAHVDFSKCNKIKYVEAYLSSIFKNLITNAIKYASEERNLVVHINAYEDNEFVVLKVQDNGIGMDLDRYGKNLFKPFKRFTEKAEGNGIGLHLIKNMAEKNGGSISVESEINKGTTFTCNLKKYG